VSIVQTNFASVLSRMSRVRRFVVLSSEETHALQGVLRNKRGRRIEVARHIRLPDNASREDLVPLLSLGALSRDGVSGILIANGDYARLAPGLISHFQNSGIEVLSERSFREKEAGSIDINQHDEQLISLDDVFERSWIAEIGERFFDVLLATALLVLATPLMAFIAVLIKFESRGPVIYRQERVGLGGRIFTLYKFRSMHQNAEADGSPQWAVIGDSRVTRIGRFIRYTRVDELPQVINVLRGHMSLIGPRPERPYFVQQLAASIPLYPLRHSIKPGITGWAQVNASYGASLDDARLKLSYDLYYLQNRSVLLNLRILSRTLRVVIMQQGAR